jgi:hypothetical protein
VVNAPQPAAPTGWAAVAPSAHDLFTHGAPSGQERISITDDQLKNAPHYATGEEWKWDSTQGQRIYDYYGVAPYWPM